MVPAAGDGAVPAGGKPPAAVAAGVTPAPGVTPGGVTSDGVGGVGPIGVTGGVPTDGDAPGINPPIGGGLGDGGAGSGGVAPVGVEGVDTAVLQQDCCVSVALQQVLPVTDSLPRHMSERSKSLSMKLTQTSDY